MWEKKKNNKNSAYGVSGEAKKSQDYTMDCYPFKKKPTIIEGD